MTDPIGGVGKRHTIETYLKKKTWNFEYSVVIEKIILISGPKYIVHKPSRILRTNLVGPSEIVMTDFGFTVISWEVNYKKA